MDEICKDVLKKIWRGEKNIMKMKIIGFLREYQFFFSIILTIIGFVILFLGVTGIWFKDIPEGFLNLNDDFLKWSFYLLVIGFIVFVSGVWYLYSFLKNRKFVLEELRTNKRSELLKRHGELKNTVKHLPSKYQKMLKEKEEELKIK